jgi:ubiquinone/menaquinone biosynthesis C-methylase UbiE
MTKATNYVHGYTKRESERLFDQADSVRTLIHHDTAFSPAGLVLEAGCGIGAQTVTLTQTSPEAQIISLDISAHSLQQAQTLVEREHWLNVQCLQANIYELPFEVACFDHLFVSYLLEHLPEPVGGLTSLAQVLKANGSIVVVEGDHGSCYFHPETEEALRAWNALIEVQAMLGGNSLIGRQLYPLLQQAGFQQIVVSPRMVYIDQSKPKLMDMFVRKTIIPMVKGVKAHALEQGLVDPAAWQKGIDDLYRLADSPDGTFCYTFFKAVAKW